MQDEFTKKALDDDQVSKISGGVRFQVKCSCCGKDINYADHRWGNEQRESANFVKGYFCDECVEKFRNGEVNDDNLLIKFKQLDSRGKPERYKPHGKGSEF